MSKIQFSKKPSTARSHISTRSSTSEKPSATTQPKEINLPAFSVPYRPKKTESELDKLKKKTIRRNAPPGEDLPCIKKILKTIKGQDTTVQEFISLVAPSTGDKGETLRVVMADDLNVFRKLARKVYETITQDNSDVLFNEQIQIAEYYKEKKNLLNARMMRIIEEIYEMVPNFDFDKYARDKQAYLEKVLPIPEELKVEPEELEMMKRQAAYHRLQWLHSEGVRLNEENNSLKKRLTQMKRQHMEEQKKMAEMEKLAERKKEVLEAAEAEKQETLQALNDSLEKTVIAQERSVRLAEDAGALVQERSMKMAAKGAVPKKKKSKAGIRKPRRPKWNEEAAAEIESHTLSGAQQTEMGKVREAFHFSPIKTPPPRQRQTREASPFHYSPPPGAQYVSPTPAPVVPRAATMAPPPAEQRPAQEFRGRRAQAPRDTWGGFY